MLTTEELFYPQRREAFTLALAPLWLPADGVAAHDWLFRRRRLQGIGDVLSRDPADFWLFTHLVSEGSLGEDSEPLLLAAGLGGRGKILQIPYPGGEVEHSSFRQVSSAFLWQNATPPSQQVVVRSQLFPSYADTDPFTLLAPYVAYWSFRWQGISLAVALLHLPPPLEPRLSDSISQFLQGISEPYRQLGGCKQQLIVMGSTGAEEEPWKFLGLKDGVAEICSKESVAKRSASHEELCVTEDPANPLSGASLPTRSQKIWVSEQVQTLSVRSLMRDTHDFSSLDPSHPNTWLAAVPLVASYGLRVRLSVPRCSS